LSDSYLWDIRGAIRVWATIAFDYASQAFANAGYLLAANAGRFETVAASGVE